MSPLSEECSEVFVECRKGRDESKDMNDNYNVMVENCNNQDYDIYLTNVSPPQSSSTQFSTYNNYIHTDKSSRSQCNKLTRGKKGRKKNFTAQTIVHEVKIACKSTIALTTPHPTNNQLRDVFLKRLHPENSSSQEFPSWCTMYGIHHNILNTEHPHVDALLDSQEPALPLLRSGRILKTKSWKKREIGAELNQLYEVFTEMKSKGMVHGGTNEPQEWNYLLLEQPVKEDEVELEDVYKIPLRRSLREGKMSRIKDDDFVYGGFIMSSEEEESHAKKREKKAVRGARSPVASVTSSSGGKASHEKERKKGRKRKLFNSKANFMSDSPSLESRSEATMPVEGKQETRKTRRCLNRTLEMLKKEGSLTDLCKE